jgi:hypothetical protein
VSLEVPSQAQGSVSSDAAFPRDYAVDSAWIDIESFSQLILTQSQRLYVYFQ